jgi:hypothetical protein
MTMKYLVIAGVILALLALIVLKLTKLAIIFGLIAFVIFLAARSGLFNK